MSNLFTDVWGRTFTQGGTVNGVEDVLARSGIGNPNTAITETLFGLNHRSLANSIPINKDYYGLTFFTKPDLRLQTENLLKKRVFAPLLTNRENSLPRAIRAMLDFRHNTHNEESYLSSLIDPKMVFIPLLTNQLVSLSGWQDIELPTHTSDAGVYGEQFSFADGIAEIYHCYDLTANFRNIPGDPITSLFWHWVHYAAAVFEGQLSPYADNAAYNAIDYQTRIYRVVLDSSKRFVQKIACTGAAFPINVPLGTSFNYETDTPINRNDQLSVTFRAIGAEYFDDIIIYDFNKAVCMGNEDMYDDQRKGAGLVKIPAEYIYLFNHAGYPRINPGTFELEWWIYSDQFTAATGQAISAPEAPGRSFITSSERSGINSNRLTVDGSSLVEASVVGNNNTGASSGPSDDMPHVNMDKIDSGDLNTITTGNTPPTSKVTERGTPYTWKLGDPPPADATNAELDIFNKRYKEYFEKLYGPT